VGNNAAVNSLIIRQQINHSSTIKIKLIYQRNELIFLVNISPKREPISNASNLKGGLCLRDYALWKNDLDGLNFNS